ncbi:integral membrane protein, partial [Lophiotrema nucula]
ITGGNYDIYGADRTIPRSMTAFTAIAWFSALETLVLIFFVFKKYSGIYFWSLLITTLGVVPYASGAWMKQNNVSHNDHFTETLLTIGWVVMVPGQSVVLYSRLHLISQNWRLIRFILYMIIFNAIVLCIPTSTLNLRQYTKNPAPYTRGYVVMEKIQMTIFTAQEVFISCVYLWEIRRVLQVVFDKKTRQSMWQLVAMNVLLLILDAALLTVEFMNFYMIETTFKSLVYAVKLKVEFGVLSQIVSVIQHNRSQPNSQTLA